MTAVVSNEEDVAKPSSKRYSRVMGAGVIGEGSAGLVLVVDDESAVRAFAERSLTSAGFRTSLAGDGDEGWAQFARDSDSFTAVVLDLRTPGIPTEDLVRRIRAVKPRIPVVLSTGFVDDDVRDRLETAGVSAFLEKPWTRDDLLRAVRGALDS